MPGRAQALHVRSGLSQFIDDLPQMPQGQFGTVGHIGIQEAPQILPQGNKAREQLTGHEVAGLNLPHVEQAPASSSTSPFLAVMMRSRRWESVSNS